MKKTEIRNILIEANLNSFVIALFDEVEDLRNYNFYDCFRPANFITERFNEEDKQKYNLDRYVFLFETMDDNLEFLVYDRELKGYIRYHIDEARPFSNYEVLTWDGTFVQQFVTWYEDDHTDDEILKICDLFGLKYGREMLESIKENLGTSYTM